MTFWTGVMVGLGMAVVLQVACKIVELFVAAKFFRLRLRERQTLYRDFLLAVMNHARVGSEETVTLVHGLYAEMLVSAPEAVLEAATDLRDASFSGVGAQGRVDLGVDVFRRVASAELQLSVRSREAV